jgi:ATP-dependent Clp protease ATP-binding subunit ClpA
VIATSNAGSEVDSGTAPKPLNARQELYDKALKTKFPPELLGRFQERLIFDFLSIEQLAKIASLHAKSQLQKFIDNCRQRGTPEPAFAVDENLYDHIAKSSDPVLGARDLRGKVEKVFQRVWMERYFEAAQKPTLVKFSVEDAVRANVNV